jgi:hypothetical protein
MLQSGANPAMVGWASETAGAKRVVRIFARENVDAARNSDGDA